ncbi:Gamma interferon inducible lysosomal thiol reductase GILT [Cordyceps fumosorosea ARSEF 2679]|uniref:Gamma interferon inducible lysosomal thiol reductase GILT n=1 Tax=Cordyceps fumosorosea (strain ARSEF 2679) TaxID=1081104 RepID=A0A167UAJ1_CORFA|nr:Gamma interferon inducible lysosomal thiol reductase GILT [Cordyceps fumosorosea ARSEF 2679]OAA61385.1 Gamma interferon inducible lysosomal thiol reductase GILT [Cordyceps fumosorosea ARSEF 2679]
MDEKRRLPLHHRPRAADMTVPVVRRRRTRLWLPVLALVLICYSLLSTYNIDVRDRLDQLSREATSVVGGAGRRKVPLEAHIMSKCPDTRDAMRQLILPAMQQVYDKVDFKLSYIGSLDDDDGVRCKHGPSECLGNIIELCARELYPDPKISLGFVMCLTKDFTHVPERSLVEDCALEHAIDIKKLNECATRDDGAHGMHLLRSSVQHSADVCLLSCLPLFSPPAL